VAAAAAQFAATVVEAAAASTNRFAAIQYTDTHCPDYKQDEGKTEEQCEHYGIH